MSLLSQPITSHIITHHRTGSLSAGIRKFFTIVSCVLFGFALVIVLTRLPGPVQLQPPGVQLSPGARGLEHAPPATVGSGLSNTLQNKLAGAVGRLNALSRVVSRLEIVDEDVPDRLVGLGRKLGRRLQRAVQARSPREFPALSAVQGTAGSGTFTVSGGEQTLSTFRRCLYVTFFLWMGTQNLISASVLWARCADIFQGAAAERVFGVLAAAATVGQLAGSSAVGLLCRNCGAGLPLGARPSASLSLATCFNSGFAAGSDLRPPRD